MLEVDIASNLPDLVTIGFLRKNAVLNPRQVVVAGSLVAIYAGGVDIKEPKKS
ncbi:hypothetical protein [Atlantibacter hermannii]|uniref:hypothetical protein n=1 Tax=Atlantibacter hermannii TaxID=565 RepID=UPI0034D6A6FF